MLESLFKLQAFRPGTLLNRLQHRCFLVNIAKILRATFLIEHFWWLLENVITSKMP